MHCSQAQIQTIQAILASEICGLADLAHKHSDRRGVTARQRGGERKKTGCGKKEKEMRREKKRMKMRSDNVTDGSPDSEHNDASLQRFKSQLSSRSSSSDCSTEIQPFSNGVWKRFLTPTMSNTEARNIR